MRLLIITQKVDRKDPILGFFHSWIVLFAKHVTQLHVICLEEGEHDFPDNVTVHSLGKEKRQSRIQYASRFYRHIWQLRNEYDSVFVHMNQVYVILGGLLWRVWGKRIGLWYLHKKVSLSLRIAEKLVDVIFTASEKSFRLPSRKVQIVGHGIDTEYFVPQSKERGSSTQTILTAGRIAPVKNIHLLLEAFLILREAGRDVRLHIVGVPVTDGDAIYAEELMEWVRAHNMEDVVSFVGARANHEMRDFYYSGDIFVNLSDTGSVDKVVLEAMACAMHVVTTNEAFENILPLGTYLAESNPKHIADAIISVSDRDRSRYAQIVVEKYGLSRLIPRIVDNLAPEH